jgi:hypothetical protein
MMRISMSPAASGLLRGLIARGCCSRDRILLTELRSTEWQSLTFLGERHQLHLQIAGPEAAEIADRIATGIEEAEFAISGHIVADISCAREADLDRAGFRLRIEALTVEE